MKPESLESHIVGISDCPLPNLEENSRVGKGAWSVLEWEPGGPLFHSCHLHRSSQAHYTQSCGRNEKSISPWSRATKIGSMTSLWFQSRCSPAWSSNSNLFCSVPVFRGSWYQLPWTFKLNKIDWVLWNALIWKDKIIYSIICYTWIIRVLFLWTETYN